MNGVDEAHRNVPTGKIVYGWIEFQARLALLLSIRAPKQVSLHLPRGQSKRVYFSGVELLSRESKQSKLQIVGYIFRNHTVQLSLPNHRSKASKHLFGGVSTTGRNPRCRLTLERLCDGVQSCSAHVMLHVPTRVSQNRTSALSNTALSTDDGIERGVSFDAILLMYMLLGTYCGKRFLSWEWWISAYFSFMYNIPNDCSRIAFISYYCMRI